MQQLELFSPKELLLLPRTQFEAVYYFMARLDIEMVSTFLDEEKTYQDFPKYLFISKLMAAFEKFEKDGDKLLSLHKGCCTACNKGCTGFTFLGKKGKFMDVIFKLKGDEIDDIFDCLNFENYDLITGKSERVDIDPIDFSLSGENPF